MVILRNQHEAEVTRQKLAWLEKKRDELLCETGGNAAVRRATSRSFIRLIKQLREELIRFEIEQRRSATAGQKK